ncbi:uncharacterized protein [Linepithema humile]|uniref:uncharacterized protein n=1 Tax=Linepithema humile TaxID=83485 RepID=UPI000623AC19|nr:PREDICTED: uncharacterized protein LOC105679670 [Linepithema humile]
MNLCNISALIWIWLCLVDESIAINKSIAVSRGFFIYRTISITQRSCNCPMSFSCTCCQSVIILYTRKEKNLCVNFTYQRNGLNVDVALSSDTISTRTVTNYRAFQFCVYVPGCLFSTACINILELNQFPRSITICLRLDIYAKKQLWQINYDCLSVSTELPMMSANNVTEVSSVEPSMTENGRMGQPLMTRSTTEMTANDMITQTTGISSTESSEITEAPRGSAEMLEMTVD